MNRISNLFDLHKTRIAVIEDDNKNLIVEYEFRKIRLSSDQKLSVLQNRSFRLDDIDGVLTIDCDDEKKLLIRISLDKPDKDKLWRFFLVLAYLLGDNITLYYTSEVFSYYHIPKTFNLGGGGYSALVRKSFLLEPDKALKAGLTLLNNKKSIFREIIYTMLQINNMDLLDVRFFGEFMLLEHLSKSQKTSGIIVNKKEFKSSKELSEILDEAIQRITDSVIFDKCQKKALINKLSKGNINNKNNTKNNIHAFIDDLDVNFSEFHDYIDYWNLLRNRKGLAHGNLLSNNVSLDDKDIVVMKKLHDLLCRLLYIEFDQLVHEK